MSEQRGRFGVDPERHLNGIARGSFTCLIAGAGDGHSHAAADGWVRELKSDRALR
jgi:hypothetical protein